MIAKKSTVISGDFEIDYSFVFKEFNSLGSMEYS